LGTRGSGGQALTGRHRERTGGAGDRPVVPEKIMPCNAGVSGGRSAVDLWGRIHGRWPHSRLRYNPRPTALALHPLPSVSCASATPRRSLCCRRYPRSFARYAPDPRSRGLDLRGGVVFGLYFSWSLSVVRFRGFEEICGAAWRF
jgi:hypothetical protein